MGSCLGGLLDAEQVLAHPAGSCSQPWVSPHSMPAKKSIARTGSPSKRKGTHPVSPRGDEDRGVGALPQRNAEGCHPVPSAEPTSSGTAATSSRSYLRVERRWRATAPVLLLPARGETCPCGKCQSAIRVPLPPRFGHRSLMSGGKQIKRHRMPAGECVCVCGGELARKGFVRVSVLLRSFCSPA